VELDATFLAPRTPSEYVLSPSETDPRDTAVVGHDRAYSPELSEERVLVSTPDKKLPIRRPSAEESFGTLVDSCV
jgi:hypothetical protein